MMLDIRDHGGQYGGGGLRKGMEIPTSRISPPSTPALKANTNSYIQSSTGFGIHYDPVSDVILHGHYNSGSTIPCKIFDRQTAKIIKNLTPASGHSSSRLYRPALGRIYANFSTGINAIADVGTSILAQIPSRFIDVIIKHHADYIIYWYNGDVLRLDLNAMTVTVLYSVGTTQSTLRLVQAWDRVLIRNNSTGALHFVSLEGALLNTITAQIPSGGLVYHAPTNTIKTISAEAGTSGGNYFYTYNPDTLVLISKVRLSNVGNTSVSIPDVASYDPVNGQIMTTVGSPNGEAYVTSFAINRDGNLQLPSRFDTTSWFDNASMGGFRHTYPFCPTKNGGYALEKLADNQYYNYLYRLTLNQSWEG